MWNLAKKSLPPTNRNKKMFSGYLATFMLHSKWKGRDGFALFMKYAAKLYGIEEFYYAEDSVPLSNDNCKRVNK